jgi:hypothetical protein
MQQAGAELVVLQQRIAQQQQHYEETASSQQAPSAEGLAQLSVQSQLTVVQSQLAKLHASMVLQDSLGQCRRVLNTVQALRKTLCMLLINHWAPPVDTGDRGSSSSGSQCSPSSSTAAGSSNSGSKGGAGCAATPADVQARRDQGQQQHEATPSLSPDKCSGSCPAYGDLDCELAAISTGLLASHTFLCQGVMTAAAQRSTSEGGGALTVDPQDAHVVISAGAAFLGLAQQLQEFGSALSAKLPVSWWCNNPDCTVLGGASELQLVGGKGCVCGGCRVAR